MILSTITPETALYHSDLGEYVTDNTIMLHYEYIDDCYLVIQETKSGIFFYGWNSFNTLELAQKELEKEYNSINNSLYENY